MFFFDLLAAGYGLATSSFALALNTYFKERRSKAAGITMALSGFGPIFYPPLITYLLSAYGVNNCVLVLGGIGLNIVLAAILLQPVKYHMKIKPETSTALVPNETLEPNPKQEDKTENKNVAIESEFSLLRYFTLMNFIFLFSSDVYSSK